MSLDVYVILYSTANIICLDVLIFPAIVKFLGQPTPYDNL